jgi:hypothetical protein
VPTSPASASSPSTPPRTIVCAACGSDAARHRPSPRCRGHRPCTATATAPAIRAPPHGGIGGIGTHRATRTQPGIGGKPPHRYSGPYTHATSEENPVARHGTLPVGACGVNRIGRRHSIGVGRTRQPLTKRCINVQELLPAPGSPVLTLCRAASRHGPAARATRRCRPRRDAPRGEPNTGPRDERARVGAGPERARGSRRLGTALQPARDSGAVDQGGRGRLVNCNVLGYTDRSDSRVQAQGAG